MRLEEWFKRVELYDRTTEEKSAEQDNKQQRSPAGRRPNPTEPEDYYRARPTQPSERRSASEERYSPSVERYPTVESRPAPENLPFIPKGRTSDSPTFRTAPAPTQSRLSGQPSSGKFKSGAPSSTSTRTPKAKRDGALKTQKETREQLLGRLLDPVLTLEEAAQVLKVCPTTVRRYTNKNLLEHYRTTGNQRRFKLSHVLNFLGDTGGSLETGTVSPEPEVQDPPRPTLRKRKARNLGGSFSSRPTTR